MMFLFKLAVSVFSFLRNDCVLEIKNKGNIETLCDCTKKVNEF